MQMSGQLVQLATTVAGVVVAVPDRPDRHARHRPGGAATWWSWPALLISSAFAGLLAATYVRDPGSSDHATGPTPTDDERRSGLRAAPAEH